MIIFPGEGLDVVIWGKWNQELMRHRHFEDRTCMINMLEDLHLFSSGWEEVGKLRLY
jgi:hypothetical protein